MLNHETKLFVKNGYGYSGSTVLHVVKNVQMLWPKIWFMCS